MAGANVSRLRRAGRRLLGEAIVLLYHRVAESEPDPWRLAVSPEHFVEQMEVLVAEGVPVALSRIVRDGKRRSLPRRAVAVTFDDGYADNLHQARPILERQDVPATVFLTSGQLGRGEFWWDELERLLLLPSQMPTCLKLRVGSEIREWIVPTGPPVSRVQLCRSVWRVLLPLPVDERRRQLDRIAEWSPNLIGAREERRALTREEAVALGHGALIEIGAHGVTHSPLTILDRASREREIRESKRTLETLLDREVDLFSYPHGEFDGVTTRMVRAAGFRAACSACSGIVWRGSSAFRLPRMLVENWDGEEFRERLWAWFEGYD